ncbi:TadE family protein [Austwickia chelonae]|uniref:TadE family protein n=1 Tax=Austwickia chelonae TaxID=100225 RepID=UPI0019683CE7|nr:TadE family protein [Austwickia chelonae]
MLNGSARRTGRAEPTKNAEEGSAVVDFVLVSILVCAITLSLLQLGFTLHVRNTLTWAASEGARAGARTGMTPEQGAGRTRDLVTQTLSTSYAQDVRVLRRVENGLAVVEVQVTAPLPVIALWGPPGAITTRGRAFAEEQ